MRSPRLILPLLAFASAGPGAPRLRRRNYDDIHRGLTKADKIEEQAVGGSYHYKRNGEVDLSNEGPETTVKVDLSVNGKLLLDGEELHPLAAVVVYNLDSLLVGSDLIADISEEELRSLELESLDEALTELGVDPDHVLGGNGESVRLERGEDGLARIDYGSVVNHDGRTSENDGLFRLLHSVFRDGAAIVTDVPHSASADVEVPEVCEAVTSMSEADLPAGIVGRAMSGSGGLSHGALYGNVFHVRVGERGSNNVAYTSEALCPHQDLAYYESPPGVQMLHCAAVGSRVVGGESILIDAMAAAHRLREVRRGSFECLLEW